MHIEKSTLRERMVLRSVALDRTVDIDLYLPGGTDKISGANRYASRSSQALPDDLPLLLINDGQDLEKMGFTGLVDELTMQGLIRPFVGVGIHAGLDRKMEYGTADVADYLGRGAKAGAYTQFVMEELLPAVEVTRGGGADRHRSAGPLVAEIGNGGAGPGSSIGFLGWSLGALSAMDIVWHYPSVFGLAGAFSGSFWWRTVDKLDPAYSEHRHRIMEWQVREGSYAPGLRFFFECGTEDETEDRNGNGIIDSIDDTQDLIAALVEKGYRRDRDIFYREIPGGRHEVATWARVLPEFLIWAYPPAGEESRPDGRRPSGK